MASLATRLNMAITLVLGVTTAGTDIDITWVVTNYDPQAATVGDTVIFTWTGSHNVFIHPTGDCTTTDAVEVSSTSPASYKFEAAGDITFACDVSSHCDEGHPQRDCLFRGLRAS